MSSTSRTSCGRVFHSSETAKENNLGLYADVLWGGATSNNLACERNDLEGLYPWTSICRYSGVSLCNDLKSIEAKTNVILFFDEKNRVGPVNVAQNKFGYDLHSLPMTAEILIYLALSVSV